MTMLNDKRLELLVQQEQERISESQPRDIDLSIIQARCLCWLVRLAERHEDQSMAAEKCDDTEQAMGWYADAHRIRDVINLITSIEIPNVNDHYPIEIEDEEDFSNTSITQESNIIIQTLDYTQRGINNSHKRSQVENLQIQKKIDLLSEKSNKIEELIKINDEKLDQINEKLLQNKKAELLLKNNDDLVYESCKLWAKEAYDDLKKMHK